MNGLLHPVRTLRADFADFSAWQVLLAVLTALLSSVAGVALGLVVGFLVLAYA